MTDLNPSAYAPYRDPRDYILSWTDSIWIERSLTVRSRSITETRPGLAIAESAHRFRRLITVSGQG